MAKESLYGIDKNLIFRETFNSEQAVRNNGGVPVDVDFSEGVGSFNGSSSIIDFGNKFETLLDNEYSFRAIVKPNIDDGIVIYLSNTTIQSSITIRLDTNCIGFSRAGVNRVMLLSDLDIATKHEIIGIYDGSGIKCYIDNIKVMLNISTWSSMGDQKKLIIGDRAVSNSKEYNGTIDLIEIYNKALTAEEVSNLYNKTTHRALNHANKILSVNTLGGVIKDKASNPLTNTNVEVFKAGQFPSMKFNGVDSMIDTGSDMIGTKAVTVFGWIKLHSSGENITGRIIDNGKTYFYIYGTTMKLFFSSNYSTPVSSNNYSIKLNKEQFIVATRKADGKASLYIGDKSNTPVLSGLTDRDSGTPEIGTTNVIIGNSADQTRTFDGLINQLTVVEGILIPEQITQAWSSTKQYIE